MSAARPSGPSVIEQLATYAAGESFDKLPEAAVRAARRAILDTLGVMLAGANALYFTLFDEAWVLKPGDDAPFTAKVVAVSAIALWLGVLYFGSMLPFLGNSF